MRRARGSLRRAPALALASVLAVSGLASMSTAAAGPANDDFANAAVIAAVPFIADFSTIGATTEPGEPDAYDACASAGSSVWFRYTPDEDDRLDFSTDGSTFAAYVGVYTGTALGDLSIVTCSRLPFVTVTAGTTYWLQVGGTGVDGAGDFFPESGEVHLEIHSLGTCEDCPTFRNYPVPREQFSFANRAGETTIGVNPKTNAAMFQMVTHTLRATWDEADEVTWKQVDGYTTSRTTFDPILWTDRETGRTFVAQLIAGYGSIMAYTDDDGENWVTTQPPQVEPAWDHQSVGGGPYPGLLAGQNPVYRNAVYYCAHLGVSFCTRSDNGGLTWGPQVPLGGVGNGCFFGHGHIKVAPDGTVAVPFSGCAGLPTGGNRQGVVFSHNAGVTFEARRVESLSPASGDPKIAYDAANRLYMATSNGGIPTVVTSDDHGRTWSSPKDLGKAYGLQNTQFPMVVAGDDGRAAVAFYGTTSPGSDQGGGFEGVWHLYVSFTYNAGKTWETIDITPGDPVQRGCIWMGGFPGTPCRNLLDFQDMTMDAEGRVLIGYADGCHTVECLAETGTPETSRSGQGVIARQLTGKRLLARFDP